MPIIPVPADHIASHETSFYWPEGSNWPTCPYLCESVECRNQIANTYLAKFFTDQDNGRWKCAIGVKGELGITLKGPRCEYLMCRDLSKDRYGAMGSFSDNGGCKGYVATEDDVPVYGVPGPGSYQWRHAFSSLPAPTSSTLEQFILLATFL